MPLWRSLGYARSTQLKAASSFFLLASLLAVCGSSFHMHCSCAWLSRKNRSAAARVVLLGLRAVSWAGHAGAVALPASSALDSGFDCLACGAPAAGAALNPGSAGSVALPGAALNPGSTPFSNLAGAALNPGSTFNFAALNPAALNPAALNFSAPAGAAPFSNLAGAALNPETGAAFAGQVAAHHAYVGFYAIARAVLSGGVAAVGRGSVKSAVGRALL
jgi:hypothetical protein